MQATNGVSGWLSRSRNDSFRLRNNSASTTSCRTPSLKAVRFLARAVFLLRKNLPHRSGRQFQQTRVVRSFAMLPNVLRQQLHRPQFLRVTQIFRLSASQRDNPSLRLRRNLRRAARSRQILQRSQCTKPKRLVDAAPDLRTIGAKAAGDRRDRRAGSVSEQHGRSRHPIHGFRPRPADGFQRRSNVRRKFQRGPAALKRHGGLPGFFSLQGSRLRHPVIISYVNLEIICWRRTVCRKIRMRGDVEPTLTDARDASAKYGVAPRQQPRRGETDGGAPEL